MMSNLLLPEKLRLMAVEREYTNSDLDQTARI